MLNKRKMTISNELIVITGPMFAGKTTKILKYYNSLKPEETLVFNHTFDNRYDGENNVISTHNKELIPCIKVKDVRELQNKWIELTLPRNLNIKNIIIDECQFFDDIDIVVNMFINNPEIEKIICAGLDLDAKGKIFNSSFQKVINNADICHKLKAECYSCGKEAEYTVCLVKNNLDENNVFVGSSDCYQPACQEHINYNF